MRILIGGAQRKKGHLWMDTRFVNTRRKIPGSAVSNGVLEWRDRDPRRRAAILYRIAAIKRFPGSSGCQSTLSDIGVRRFA